MKHTYALLAAGLAFSLLGTGCQTAPTNGNEDETTSKPRAEQSATQSASWYARDGFRVTLEDGRLWVLKPGQEQSGKHVTFIGAGPQGLTVKALDNETALEYLAAKPGFEVSVEDGRLWVLKPGQEKSGKHVTFIGAGPKGTTLKALDNETALEYLAAKPGFEVSVDDGRLWVLKPGQEKSGKHVTFIGAGPKGMTLKALDNETALEYMAAKPGFEVSMEDGRLWVLKPGDKMSGKHVTRIAAGPQRTTLKALDDETMDRYLSYQP
ncbi:hypothetical protein [Ectothiorhodospira mobilis]|uniref:hypothetical protein n=1 Tax=Ectothiorhodospira mobilis TaxID=195064 RepID=UPI001908F833|nr:hypothetical protein [Ectothiorhodospira mobilis]